jgi:hypothetical protein
MDRASRLATSVLATVLMAGCRPPPAVLCTSDVGIHVTDLRTGAPLPRPDGRYVVAVGQTFDLVVSDGGLPLAPRMLWGPSGLDADLFDGMAIGPLHLRLAARRPAALVSFAWAFDDRGIEVCRDVASFSVVPAAADAGVDGGSADR